MPLKNGGHWEERFFHDLSTLPLPGAAVVIDVRDERYCDDHDTPLISYLAIELEDLAMEMRLNQVARWRYLADCIELLRIETIPPDAKQDEFVDIKLTNHRGKQVPIQGRDDLAKTIGRGYIDRVRNQHIKAMKDNGPDEEELQTPIVDPEQPTVRVFFLTDMEDRDSLERASTYARWLKDWINEQHGVRSYNRDERISTIAVCLNAPSNGQEAILRSLGGWSMPSDELELYTALDMVILMQAYRDDAAYIGGEEQIYQAELILYTLLLHWPEMLTADGQGAWYELDGISDLPWPTYTVGVAALEYSARWGARWLDYGLTARALELLRDAKKVDDELKALRPGVQGWFNAWWDAVKFAIPDALSGPVVDIKGLAELHDKANRSPFKSGSRLKARDELKGFTDKVAELYQPSGAGTLQRVIDDAPIMLDQIRQNAIDPAQQGVWQETSSQLTPLYISAQQFIDSRFREAWGAIPRAMQQIAALRECVGELRSIKQNMPNIEAMYGEFERAEADASKQLRRSIRTWKAPVVHEFLQSTALSLGFALLVLIVLWVALPGLLSAPAILLRPLVLGISGLQMLCLLFVVVAEAGYLLLRNRTFEQEQQAIYQELSKPLLEHYEKVRDFVAANAALTLLEWTDLYMPGEGTSPYEERLKKLDKTLEAAQIASRRQQHIADQRLRLSLDQKLLRNALEPPWPNLNNRKDLLTWRSIEDSYLSACSELEQNFPPLNFLSKMLIRRVGTEKTDDILQSLMPAALAAQGLVRQTTVRSLLEVHDMRTPTRESDEIRFQMLSTMLVGVLLTSETVPPVVQDVLPLIESYSRQKDNYLPELSALASDVLSLGDLVRETMLQQALHSDQAVNNFTLRPDISVEFVLASWMRQQNLFNAAFAENLEENDIITLLDRRKIKLKQALDNLRQRCDLDGYPDDKTGDDFFLLLLAPGWSSNAFIVNGVPQDDRPNKEKPILFPDAEKMVYLHIHRLRQLLPGTTSRDVVKY